MVQLNKKGSSLAFMLEKDFVRGKCVSFEMKGWIQSSFEVRCGRVRGYMCFRRFAVMEEERKEVH